MNTIAAMNTITALEPGHLARLARLYVEIFNGPPWHDGWTEAVALERLSGFAAVPTFWGLGQWHGERLLGFALGWGERWVDGWTFHLKEMGVAPELQGQGQGRALMQALGSGLRERGYQSINLQTSRGSPAAQFYATQGFVDLNLLSLHKSL
ncbi:GNAT family N-acetyltransferase [Curvibacter sp. HBC61]|uniref:GNAT family N-acetyltransferase n=1 Tax=Curvibacter cyanobacteriorum TaxID=3026422 RepID=A0ABT5MU20_9BURK|nr:GNAT family N-acetyltransferase [Curvibacter sp. HBC61]MDD0837537.1 GNAT family N-acetyltransferase [Curvibacter sp. HBC61]